MPSIRVGYIECKAVYMQLRCFSVPAAHISPTPGVLLFYFVSASDITLHVFQAPSHFASSHASVGIIPLPCLVFAAQPGLVSSVSLSVCFHFLNPDEAVRLKGASKDLIHFIRLA